MGRHGAVVDRGAEFDAQWAASVLRAAAHVLTSDQRIERLRESVSDHYRMQRDRVRAARELEARDPERGA